MQQFKRWILPALLLSGLWMEPARAQSTDPIDCTNGCTIVTCEGSTCWVWQCDSSGCRITGSYRRKAPPAQRLTSASLAGKPRAFDQVCEVRGESACTYKTCQAGECTVSMFNGKDFVQVGRVQDLDAMIERARKQMQP